MADLIVGLILLAAVGTAAGFLRRARKRGSACMGCPSRGACQGRQNGCQG